MSIIVAGGIGFNNATTPPPAPGTITGATNGLQVLGGTNIGLGGTLSQFTTITTLNSSTLYLIPTAGEQNTLLSIGHNNNTQQDTFLNVFSNYTGPFQQKAIYISDKAALSGEGFLVYYDTVNNGLQVEAAGGAGSFNIPNTAVVIGNSFGTTGAQTEIVCNTNFPLAFLDSISGGIAGFLWDGTSNTFGIFLGLGGTGTFNIGDFDVNARSFISTGNANNSFNGNGGLTIIGSNTPIDNTSRVNIIGDASSGLLALFVCDASSSDGTQVYFDVGNDELVFNSTNASSGILFSSSANVRIAGGKVIADNGFLNFNADNSFNTISGQTTIGVPAFSGGSQLIVGSTANPQLALADNAGNEYVTFTYDEAAETCTFFNTGTGSKMAFVFENLGGIVIPRMTQAQRLAIASPAVSTLVYQTDAVEGLYINKSGGWTFII